MEQLQGIKNFTANIQPVMLRIRNGRTVTKPELESVLQFYLEVVNYLAKADKEVTDDYMPNGNRP